MGCILFEYTAYNLIVGDNAKVYVICQQYDAESVYFYEDCCYMYASDGESELQMLKDKNDWDKPLDYSKMAQRAANVYLRHMAGNITMQECVPTWCAAKYQCCRKSTKIFSFVQFSFSSFRAKSNIDETTCLLIFLGA